MTSITVFDPLELDDEYSKWDENLHRSYRRFLTTQPSKKDRDNKRRRIRFLESTLLSTNLHEKEFRKKRKRRISVKKKKKKKKRKFSSPSQKDLEKMAKNHFESIQFYLHKNITSLPLAEEVIISFPMSLFMWKTIILPNSSDSSSPIRGVNCTREISLSKMKEVNNNFKESKEFPISGRKSSINFPIVVGNKKIKDVSMIIIKFSWNCFDESGEEITEIRVRRRKKKKKKLKRIEKRNEILNNILPMEINTANSNKINRNDSMEVDTANSNRINTANSNRINTANSNGLNTANSNRLNTANSNRIKRNDSMDEDLISKSLIMGNCSINFSDLDE